MRHERDTSSDDPPPIPEPRLVPDSIHPRFHPNPDHLYQCRSCNYESYKKEKIEKHFLKTCSALSQPLRHFCPEQECSGPSFSYMYKGKISIYHDCRKWARFLQKPRGREFLARSSNGQNSLSTSSTSINERSSSSMSSSNEDSVSVSSLQSSVLSSNQNSPSVNSLQSSVL